MSKILLVDESEIVIEQGEWTVKQTYFKRTFESSEYEEEDLITIRFYRLLCSIIVMWWNALLKFILMSIFMV